MAPHSSTLAWKIPWTEEPGGLHSMGLPFPSPMKVKSESEVAQLCLTLLNPMECSPPGSSVRGIL